MTSQQRYEEKMDVRKMQKIRGRCSVPGCKSVNIVGGKHFFYFPREPMRCWKWLRFCGLEDRYRVAADATHRLRICMDHFIESDYYSSSQKVILKQTAVPTVHANGLVVPSNPKIRSPPSSPVMPRATLSPVSTPTFRHHKTLRTYARRAKIDSAATEGNSMIGEQLRGYQQPSLLFNVVPTAEVVMDVIKTEPGVDPLTVQSSDDPVKEEANAVKEGNLLDVHVTRIKEECVEDSYNHTSEIKFEEIILPNNFPVVKCEAQKDLFDVDRLQQEQKAEVSSEEDEEFPERIAATNERTVSTESDGVAHEENGTVCEIPKNSGSSGRHVRIHEDKGKWQFDMSKKRPSGSVKLKTDLRKRGVRKPYKCKVCGKSFSQSGSGKRHELLHTGVKPFKCNVCDKSFSQFSNLKIHERLHIGKKHFKCCVCGKTFSKSSSPRSHERQDTEEKTLNYICGKCFSEASNPRTHKRLHTGEKLFKCDVCGKCFSTSSSLKRHELLHTGEKAFKCDACGKCFSESGNLRRHERIHTIEKPFRCDVCGMCFPLLDSLRNHERLHTGEKPCKCHVCGKGFLYSSYLKRHVRVHTGTKPFKCHVCGKCFWEQTSLKRHERIHRSEKPFKCDVCGKCFSDSSNLKRHESLHTGEKPLKNGDCSVSLS
ncbi:zinc finger protein 675-like isoform X2 [Periplaneta americana]|uniref:zinc finger protein 675-like isoform X2 n=1 Tax=Periplaneta americana TaxID=6978 RepID=UPI0037E78E0B